MEGACVMYGEEEKWIQVLVGTTELKWSLGRPRCRRKSGAIKVDI
jgi:hypothetical protein